MNQRTNQTLVCIFAIITLSSAHYSIAAASSYIPARKAVSKVASTADINSVRIQIALNKSRLITLDKNIAEISQGNPSIADFPVDAESAETTFVPPNQILIRGKSLGTTNLILWDNKGKVIKILDIEVTHDLGSLKTKLHEILPNENIGIRSVQKNIVLSGEVSTPLNMQAAVNLAQGFLGSSMALSNNTSSSGGGSGSSGNINLSTNTRPTVDPSRGAIPMVINLMNVGGAQQVMLDVKVAEIDRKLLKGLNVKFSALQVSNAFSIGAVNGGGLLNAEGIGGALTNHSFDAGALFLQAISGQFIFNLTIDAANEHHLAKILAQPTLTTLSGQEANFFSGGEFPVPVPQSGLSNGTITVQFKKFGIELKFLPLVLDSGRINLNMDVGVSEIESANVFSIVPGSNSTYNIPSLTKREASSTLELADGQTMSIAGLISDSLRENINKFPGLGDIPGLGLLFRSSQFLNQQTELVIFVTPHLAKPVLARNARLPTDGFVEPDDVDFYILGRTESRKVRNRWVDKNVNPVVGKGGLDGDYGQQLIEGGR